MKVLVVYSCLFLLFPISVYGEPSYPKDTIIFYGNGVLTDQAGAETSKRVLEKKVQLKLAGSNIQSQIFFDVAYNRTNVMLDLVEAFFQ